MANPATAESITQQLRTLTRAPRRSVESTTASTPRGARAFGTSVRTGGKKWRANPHPEITDLEIRFLRALLADKGLRKVAGWIGVSDVVVLRVVAGLGFRCQPAAMEAVRAFFAESDLQSAARGRGQPIPTVSTIGRDSPQKRGTKKDGKRESSNATE